SQRIGRVGGALLAASRIAGAVAGLVAVALLHRFGQTLGALAQRFERSPLRVHCALGITFAEPAGGIAHCRIGLVEPVLAVALLAALTLLALPLLIAALTLLAALARSHAALGKLFLQFLQPVAQPLLVLLQVAHALVALLAAHAVAP